MDSFEKIIEHAICLEDDASKLYLSIADRTKRPEIKKVFEEMAAQEEGHKRKLQKAIDRHSLPQGKKYTPDEDLKIADYVISVDLDKPDLSYQDALAIGMKLEKASMELYQKLADRSFDEQSHELFTFLAEEEAKHKANFEAKYDDLL